MIVTSGTPRLDMSRPCAAAIWPMRHPTGREVGVDAHLVGDRIEELVWYPDRKDILNENRDDVCPFEVVGTERSSLRSE